MAPAPLFSIILPTYNRSFLLKKAIRSVIEQTFEDWELVIVDDGSTDNTREIVDSFHNKRIWYYFQENQGRSAARNNGINFARGRYICFLDSDDFYLENHLKVFFNSINQNNQAKVFIINGMFISKKNKLTPIPISLKEKGSLNFFFENTIHSQQICCSKEILEQNRFNEKLSIGEDLELWLRIADKHKLEINDEKTLVVFDHEDRSVNKKKNNPGLSQLKSYRVIFRNNKFQNQKISFSKKRFLISNALAACGFHYFLNDKKLKSIKYISLSIIIYPIHPQTKFKLYSIFAQIPVFHFIFKKSNVASSFS